MGWLKSKRSRSGATSEPFCVTCSPRRRRSASCSRWVAEWLARSAARRSPSTRSSTASPTASAPWVDPAEMDVQIAQLLLGVGDRELGAAGAEKIAGYRPSGRRTSP